MILSSGETPDCAASCGSFPSSPIPIRSDKASRGAGVCGHSLAGSDIGSESTVIAKPSASLLPSPSPSSFPLPDPFPLRRGVNPPKANALSFAFVSLEGGIVEGPLPVKFWCCGCCCCSGLGFPLLLYEYGVLA
ncbi:unnamed protein product [Tuber melanosporum]|uniref:(Perigord truffle) hypothetical protein n=1 Tax=Tuber melanosporum (strain Mel28) TaxID=656061 RepID=D5G6Z0_TUBMM|nr:uncharacterized protein GSTUM_00002390001 [Tuber melanosporum]CAZ80283.1 unnamed protein product [Tuber melanosporum]